jgi:hypothetical protein
MMVPVMVMVTVPLAVDVMGHMLMGDRWCGGDLPCI